VLQADTGSLVECEFRISGHAQKSEDSENIQMKLTIYSSVVAGLWPEELFLVARDQK